jgi:hypothetical protein
MFIGKRDEEARTLFLTFRGGRIADKSWDDVMIERIAELRDAGCKHVLIEEVERLFRATSPPTSVDIGATLVPLRFAAKDAADETLINASDMQSGDRLFEAGWLEDALHVYNRRLKHCGAMIAAGRVNNQILEDNGALPRKFSEIAFEFLLRGEPAKAIATTGRWMFAVPSELHPVLAVRRAHALAFLGRDEEAREIYRSYRGRLVERGLTVERLMANDFAQLEAAGQTLPPALRDEFQPDG